MRTSGEEDSPEGTEDGNEEPCEVEGPELVSVKCSMCKNCDMCVYHILAQCNLVKNSYHVTGLAYKFLLTISTTQVACEKIFYTKICEE